MEGPVFPVPAAFRQCTPLLAALLLPTAVHAQAVNGRAVDAGTGGGIAGVAVRAINADSQAVASVVTDSTGAFALPLRAAGAYRLEARHIAYWTITTDSLLLEGGESVEVVVRMAARPLELDPLVVVSRRPDPRHRATHDGFRARHASAPSVGSRRVVDRDDLEFRNAMSIGDILRHFVPPRSCITYYWDGHMILNAQMEEARLSTPIEAIQGVEYYRYSYDAPLELRQDNPRFNNQVLLAEGGSARCSIVAVWSRNADPRNQPQPAPPPTLPATAHLAAAVEIAPARSNATPRLVGQVRVHGTAEPGGMVVELVGPRGERFGTVRADDDGAFAMIIPGPGRYHLRVLHRELGAATSDGFDLPDGSGARVVLTVGG
jgi:hypothetical protein